MSLIRAFSENPRSLALKSVSSVQIGVRPFAHILQKAMPELPEVETIANGVHERVHGQTIQSVWTSNKPQTFKSSPAQIAGTLTHSRIDRVHRVGKTIVVDLSHNNRAAQFLIHLANAETKYSGPGKEPLTIPIEDFIVLFRNRKTPIKAALLNQSLLHGVGNIYADEALFHAGVRPLRHAGRLTRAELTRLRAALQKVLTEAIQLGGSSVSDYVDADGAAGFFQLHHHVYSRTNQPCRICQTPIKRIIVGGRSTHFCPTCQH